MLNKKLLGRDVVGPDYLAHKDNVRCMKFNVIGKSATVKLTCKHFLITWSNLTHVSENVLPLLIRLGLRRLLYKCKM